MMKDGLMSKIDSHITVSPIKINGKKTKLIPWIKENFPPESINTFIEPFFGSGVVGFNCGYINVIANDINNHIIDFYNKMNTKEITPEIIKTYLEINGKKLLEIGEDHYYDIREKFNKTKESLDFLFLNRSCFNGLMRFNRKGEWNVPFCKNPNKFSEESITTICKQVNDTYEIIVNNNYSFFNKDFEEIINMGKEGDLIYCDPPYFDLETTYSNDSWTEVEEIRLFNALDNTKAKFIMSSWLSKSSGKTNKMIDKYWKKFNILEKEHSYQISARNEGRKPVTEVLIKNF